MLRMQPSVKQHICGSVAQSLEREPVGQKVAGSTLDGCSSLSGCTLSSLLLVLCTHHGQGGLLLYKRLLIVIGRAAQKGAVY